MNDTEGKFTLPSSTYIISPLPLFYSPVIFIPLCWPWTCTHTRSFFSFMVSFVFLRLSLPVSVTLSPTSHLSIPPSLPGMDSGEPISSRSCLLFATVNSASRGKWPPLFIGGLFIWTTWLLCPNPEITFGWLWKGWCVSVIRRHVFMLDWHLCPVAMVFCLAKAKSEGPQALLLV